MEDDDFEEDFENLLYEEEEEALLPAEEEEAELAEGEEEEEEEEAEVIPRQAPSKAKIKREPKLSFPRLEKYELTALVNVRARAIDNNAPPVIPEEELESLPNINAHNLAELEMIRAVNALKKRLRNKSNAVIDAEVRNNPYVKVFNDDVIIREFDDKTVYEEWKLFDFDHIDTTSLPSETAIKTNRNYQLW